jgi:hypothetical protein
MLTGFVEELEHDYKDLFRPASFSGFGSTEKDWLLALQAKLIISSHRDQNDDIDSEDDDDLMDISPDPD